MASLKYVTKEGTNDPPVLAVFPSGIPTDVSEKSDFPFQFLSSKEPRLAKKGYLYAESSQARFVGNNYDHQSISSSNHNYAVGVFRPGKNAVKVVSANGLFVMRQTNVNDLVGIDKVTISNSDFNTVREELTERFGSRKRRRELRSQQAAKFDVNTDESSMLAVDTAMAVASRDIEEHTPTDDIIATRMTILPKYDDQTTEVDKMYPVKSFLPVSLWDNLDTNSLIKPKETKDELEYMYPSYVLLRRSRFNNLKGAEAEDVARKLLILAYLLRMVRLSFKPFGNLAEAISCPVPVAEYLRKNFASGNRITTEFKSKVLCHAAILALTTSTNYYVDQESLAAFAADCNLTVSELTPYFREIGAKINPRGAKLSAPLTLPDVNPVGKKRR